MNKRLITSSTRLLLCGAIALPLALGTANSTAAQSCKSGSCGGPNNVEQVVKAANSAKSTVRSASLGSAYSAIKSVATQAEKLDVEGTNTVKRNIAALAKILEDRAEEQYDAAVENYFEGDHQSALNDWQEIAELKGFAVAKQSERELSKEDDRKAWREARDLAKTLISSGEFGQARLAVNDMNRLARRTDYTKQTKVENDGFAQSMMPAIEKGASLVAAQQYEQAYTMLIEVSRISHARKSASEARRELGKHASVEGMRLAKGEYEGKEALTKVQNWIGEIAHPSPAERTQYKQQLDMIANKYKGTFAAEQAKQLLMKDSQAANF